MTNREWLFNQMQNMSDEEFAGVLDVRDIICQNTYTYSDCVNNRKDCKNCVLNWLKAEHKEKITLSEAERVILESLDHEYWYIARNKNGTLTIFLGMPRKESEKWNSRGFKFVVLNCFNHLFQFIKWEDEEAYNIAELLKGE